MRSGLNKRKIINDPVWGFIKIPSDLVYDVIEHPFFQRMRRIKQLGLTSYVYPSAVHTRFQHALGGMHLMSEAIEVLRSKGHEIAGEEAEGLILAILLHDLGHGPFSHTLENSIVSGISHETVSRLLMEEMNRQFGGRLSPAASIFSDTYPKRFLHQLVSSQLDMDRLDYLTRDSFFTGVAEGVINADRIIKMLTVANDELLVEAKGIYSIEKFIVSRRLMYWQVYYHKTVMVADFMLISILRRAKQLAGNGVPLFATPALNWFLLHHPGADDHSYGDRWIEHFTLLDDFDIFTSIKVWADHPDGILRELCRRLINRELFRIELQNEPFKEERVASVRQATRDKFRLTDGEASLFVIEDTVTNNAYNPRKDKIRLLFRDHRVMDISEASDQLNISVLSKPVRKHLLCYPKEIFV